MSDKPTRGVEVTLHFPHVDWTVYLPVVPRKGELFDWEDPDHGGGRWEVTEVVHVASPDEADIALTLDPADEDARKQATEK